MSYTVPLVPDAFYHIYNRGINGENIFNDEENYNYFLKCYDRHMPPYVHTFAYSLLPNHFHLLIKVKAKNTEKPTHQVFSNLFNAYAKAFNGMYKRHGSLFERPFKRKPIKTHVQLTETLFYIHHNPIKHGFVVKMSDWPFTSFRAYLSEKTTNLNRDEGFHWFDGRQGFIEYHHNRQLDHLEGALDWEGEITSL